MTSEDTKAELATDAVSSSATDDAGKARPKFEPPKVITYSGDDILDELGPAHACSPYGGAVVGC